LVRSRDGWRPGGRHRGLRDTAIGSSERKRAPDGARKQEPGTSPAEGSGERGDGRRAAAGQLTGGRYTSTGRSEWVSTLAVTLPSTSALMPRRPCEAIATRSQPRSRAVWMMASCGSSALSDTTSKATPELAASSL